MKMKNNEKLLIVLIFFMTRGKMYAKLHANRINFKKFHKKTTTKHKHKIHIRITNPYIPW